MDDRLHIVVSMGVYDPGNTSYLSVMRMGQLLVTLLSVARTTPNCVIHFIYDGIDKYFIYCCGRILASTGSASFEPLHMSVETAADYLSHCRMNGIGSHSMIRMALSQVFPDLGNVVWLDCDVVVFDDLNKFARECRESLAKTRFYYAGAAERGRSIINAGVMYIDLDRLRSMDGEESRLLHLCDSSTDEEGSGITVRMLDQDVVNAVGAAHVDERWNVTLHDWPDVPPFKLPDNPGCLHFTGSKKYVWSCLSQYPEYAFLNEMTEEVFRLCPDLDSKYRLVYVPSVYDDSSDLVKIPSRNGLKVAPVTITESRPAYVDSVHVAYGVSGPHSILTCLPASMLSYAMNSSVPVSFHVVCGVEDEDRRLVDSLSTFMDNFKSMYGASVFVHDVPERVKKIMESAGDGLESNYWRNHMVSGFPHEVPGIPDIVVKADADTICVGDVGLLVDYCLGHGLDEETAGFAVRSLQKGYFLSEWNFGVFPVSTRMLRESGYTGFVEKAVSFGSNLLLDELTTRAWLAGLFPLSELPLQWNMLSSLRASMKSEMSTFPPEVDRFYGMRCRTPGYRPMFNYYNPEFGGEDYRRVCRIYHFSGMRGRKSAEGMPDSDIWDRYANMARAMGGYQCARS